MGKLERMYRAAGLAFVLVAFVLHGSAVAGGRDEIRKQAEMSMLLTGSIEIDRDGSVAKYELDNAGDLPPVAARIMDQASATWRFEPVIIDGKPVRARTAMSVRLAAKPRENSEGFDVRISAANFGKPGEGEWVTSKGRLLRPKYPPQAAAGGVRGTVYVVVRIGRDGKVEDAVAEQVNLGAVDRTEAAMQRWRDTLAGASLQAARRWTFVPPTRGEEADAPFWLARVPVSYLLPGDKVPVPGKWETYIPGPRQSAPWLGGIDASLGADAVAGDGIFPLKGGPRLLTPLNGS